MISGYFDIGPAPTELCGRVGVPVVGTRDKKPTIINVYMYWIIHTDQEQAHGQNYLAPPNPKSPIPCTILSYMSTLMTSQYRTDNN
jgi:hypothetical protein